MAQEDKFVVSVLTPLAEYMASDVVQKAIAKSDPETTKLLLRDCFMHGAKSGFNAAKAIHDARAAAEAAKT